MSPRTAPNPDRTAPPSPRLRSWEIGRGRRGRARRASLGVSVPVRRPRRAALRAAGRVDAPLGDDGAGRPGTVPPVALRASWRPPHLGVPTGLAGRARGVVGADRVVP